MAYLCSPDIIGYMEELLAKIKDINSLVKALNASPNKPTIAKPKMPSIEHEVPKANTPEIKKDPVKVSEQLKNPDLTPKKDALKTAKKNHGKLKINKLGQWSLNSSGKK